jgi:hypothetical protein
LLTPVIIEEKEEEEVQEKAGKLDQITTFAKIKNGNFIVNQGDR